MTDRRGRLLFNNSGLLDGGLSRRGINDRGTGGSRLKIYVGYPISFSLFLLGRGKFLFGPL